MKRHEQIIEDALRGNKAALKELEFYAGSGDAEAQYFLSQYYLKISGNDMDEDYLYWLRKSQENGYVAAEYKCQEQDYSDKTDENSGVYITNTRYRPNWTTPNGGQQIKIHYVQPERKLGTILWQGFLKALAGFILISIIRACLY